MTPDQWYDVINTNLNSLFNMCRPVIEGMRERGFGRIINISSVNGQKGQMGQANYSASKAGDIGFTKALAQENANKGVTVNAICPGYIATEMVLAVPKDVLEKAILPQISSSPSRPAWRRSPAASSFSLPMTPASSPARLCLPTAASTWLRPPNRTAAGGRMRPSLSSERPAAIARLLPALLRHMHWRFGSGPAGWRAKALVPKLVEPVQNPARCSGAEPERPSGDRPFQHGGPGSVEGGRGRWAGPQGPG